MSLLKVFESIKFPHAFDYVSKRNSATLFFAYISFLLSVASLILLHKDKEYIIATAMSVFFFILCMVFYMLRGRLTSFKLDLDDKSVEISSEKNNSN